jgi:hypothetical protein
MELSFGWPSRPCESSRERAGRHGGFQNGPNFSEKLKFSIRAIRAEYELFVFDCSAGWIDAAPGRTLTGRAEEAPAMAKIVELNAHASPPKGADWAMVVVHRPGVEARGSVVRHDSGATFYAPAIDAEIARAIEKATAWADAHSVGTVYVRRDATPSGGS